MNLSYENQFIKSLVLDTYHTNRLRERVDSPIFKFMSDELYESFIAWLLVNHVKYDTTRAKFCMRVTKLVRNEEKHTGFDGLKKSRCGQGVMYKMDARALHAELRAQQWLTHDEM